MNKTEVVCMARGFYFQGTKLTENFGLKSENVSEVFAKRLTTVTVLTHFKKY